MTSTLPSWLTRYFKQKADQPAANAVEPVEQINRLGSLIDELHRKSAELRALAEQIDEETRRTS
jgi:hypothetical protein